MCKTGVRKVKQKGKQILHPYQGVCVCVLFVFSDSVKFLGTVTTTACLLGTYKLLF